MTRTWRELTTAGAALALSLALAGAAQAQSGGFELITPAEAQQTAKAERDAPQIRTRQIVVPRPDAPEIQVISPAAEGTTLAAPLRIELAFTPKPGKRIVPSSFRVLYGLLKIDLTERLRKHAKVTEEGVVVDRAVVPEGQHRLILQVADDKGNTAEQELRIRVGAAS